MMQWPFDVKEIGHPIEPTSPFYAFMRGQRPPFSGYQSIDQSERLLIFRRVGTFPLTVSVATPLAVSYPAPVLWLVVLGTGLIGYGFHLADASGVVREAAQRGIRTSKPGEVSLPHDVKP